MRRVGIAAALLLLLALSACSGPQQAIVSSPAGASPTATTPASVATTVATSTTRASASSTAVSTSSVSATTTTTVPEPTTTAVPPTTTTTIQPVPSLAEPIKPLRSGARGDAVVALQSRLLDLGFWLNEPDGQYGLLTNQAVMAFQKYHSVTLNLKPTGIVDDATAEALGAVAQRALGYSVEGDLIEVDKARQVMFVVRGGRTLWTFNTSTGSGETYTEPDLKKKDGSLLTDIAITPEGNFKVYNEYTDGWEKGQLGELYRPKYFKGGVAIHGSNSIPNYPASHGCVRLTTTAMDWIWSNDMMPRGSAVWVHDGG